MSFILNDPLNTKYQPGWFLASADCRRETVQVAQNHSQVVTKADGSKYVPAGAVIPANGSTAKGILYEDVDVTSGDMPGSLVTEGVVYEDRLPASVQSAAKNVLTGIKFIANAPVITRPDFTITDLATLTVESAAGTAAGDTALTVSGYTLKSGEGWKYKVGDTAATVIPGEVIGSGWTAWNGTADITAATDKKLALVAVNTAGQAVAYGSCTVTAKA